MNWKYTFGDLEVGDMFNTKPARFVKIDDDKAIVVMSSIFNVGDIRTFKKDDENIVILYSILIED